MDEIRWVMNPHLLEVFIRFRDENLDLLQLKNTRRQFDALCIAILGTGSARVLDKTGIPLLPADWWNKSWTWCEDNIDIWRYYWAVFFVALFTEPSRILRLFRGRARPSSLPPWLLPEGATSIHAIYNEAAGDNFTSIQLNLSEIISSFSAQLLEQKHFRRNDWYMGPWCTTPLSTLLDEGIEDEWNGAMSWNEWMLIHSLDAIEDPNYNWSKVSATPSRISSSSRSSVAGIEWEWFSFLVTTHFPTIAHDYTDLLDRIQAARTTIKALNYPGGSET